MEVAPRYKLFALFTDLFGDHPDFFKILPYLTKKRCTSPLSSNFVWNFPGGSGPRLAVAFSTLRNNKLLFSFSSFLNFWIFVFKNISFFIESFEHHLQVFEPVSDKFECRINLVFFPLKWYLTFSKKSFCPPVNIFNVKCQKKNPCLKFKFG